MATEPTYEFPLPQNGYAAFDAISMRNLILDRLNAQNIYTDQNYIGSNLAAIIDVISYSFNTLLYYLNRTSSEATFTEAQIYENIARLTKILDYKPVGYQTSTLTFSCSSSSLLAGSYTIPKYSSVTANGVSFSFNEDISFTISDGTVTTALTELSNKKLLYQGTYKESTVVTATGEPNEIIVLDNSVGYIDHFNIDVYVHEAQTKNWYQYKNVPNLYTERPESRVFEKTFNSNSIYEIKFGNGISGRQLQAGDKVIIYYLQSSGPAGIVGPNTLANKSGSNVAYSATLQEIRNNTNLFGLKYLTGADLNTLEFDNFVGSTYPRAGETADSIRANAPGVFKSQYRLVTKNDYLAYIRTNFSQFISDVRVFSNWEYVADYLKYFKSINANAFGFNQVMFNQVAYADACNFNNIYVCAIPRISAGASAKYLLSSQKDIIKVDLENLKCVSTEITFLDPIYKAIAFGVKQSDGTISDSNLNSNFLVINKIKGSTRTSNSIQAEAVSIIKNAFNPINSILGGTFKYTDLVNQLLNISGVSNIRTINTVTGVAVEGVSFYYWNPNYPDVDKSIITSNITLRDFEYMYFDNLNNIGTRIQVV